MRIDISVDLKGVMRGLDDVARRQVPFAMSVALNETAKAVQATEENKVRGVFDRPTPSTISAIYSTRSTKANLAVIIGVKDKAGSNIPPAKYLRAQIEGGSRSSKRFEVALRAAGVLPHGYYVVHGEGVSLDVWGNQSRGQIVQILSWFKAFPESGRRSNMTDKRRAALIKGGRTRRAIEYFAVQPGDKSGLHPGIWQRVGFGFGKALQPVMMFVRQPRYAAAFDFVGTAITTIGHELPRQFDRAFAQAIRTARK